MLEIISLPTPHSGACGVKETAATVLISMTNASSSVTVNPGGNIGFQQSDLRSEETAIM
jgi:hypothetical protein